MPLICPYDSLQCIFDKSCVTCICQKYKHTQQRNKNKLWNVLTTYSALILSFADSYAAIKVLTQNAFL